MSFGICNLSIVPLRFEPSDKSELTSQVLYGDLFEIIEIQPKWSYIKLVFDDYQGWIDNKQFLTITKESFQKFKNTPLKLTTNLVEFVTCNDDTLLPIPLGANVNAVTFFEHEFDGSFNSEKFPKKHLLETAFNYLNAPYLWGGKTPFGIDCSGFTQMVYKINGHALLRDASQQATQGEVLSFLEESEAGDLAFFDNEEGIITHVGIIMPDNYIIHAHGKVRIDKLDHSGIYNLNTKRHTHKLRVIRKIIS